MATPLSRLRRFAAGAWSVPAGFLFILRTPRLWPLAALPAALAAGLMLLGVAGAFYTVSSAERLVIPPPDRVGQTTSIVLGAVLGLGLLGAGALLGLGVALVLSAPILDRISRDAEAHVRGDAPEAGRGLGWEIATSLRSAFYFLAAAPGIVLLGLIPAVGPLLAGLWAAHALAFQNTEAALCRRGLGFADRRSWHRAWRPESMGFGLAGLLFLLVPCAGLLVAPALAVGGTLLVLDLEEESAPAIEAGPGGDQVADS